MTSEEIHLNPALEKAGANVDWLRWWDDSQKVDLIHYFGRPSPGYLHYAHAKKIKVVMAPLLTGMGSRSQAVELGATHGGERWLKVF